MRLASLCFGLLLWASASNAQSPEIAAAVLKVEIGAHVAPVRRLAVDKKRRLVVTASEDKSARLWSLDTGELLHIFRPTIGAERLGILYGAAIHPSKPIVALGGSTGGAGQKHQIHFFDYVARRYIKSIDALAGDIKNLAWGSEGRYLFATYAGDNALRAFDWSGELAFEHRFSGPVYALDAGAGGVVAAASLDGAVLMLKVTLEGISSQTQFTTGAKKPVSVSVSPDGRSLAIGYFNRQTAPQIFSVDSGRLDRTLPTPNITSGAVERVEWTPDGRTLVVAGRGHRGKLDQVPVFWIDTTTDRVTSDVVVASDSVAEIISLDNNRILFGSFDGSWGVATPRGVEYRVASAIPDLRGAENLLVSARADTISWTSANSKHRWSFSFDNRVVSSGEASGLLNPKVKLGFFDNPEWNNSRRARVNGNEIKLASEEISRSLTYLRNKSGDAILGTSRRLLRIGENGKIAWSVPTAGEIRAVNITEDDRLIVTAMTDGTVRWWRATDGLGLLTFLGLPENKWIAWTPSGYYDASLGADQYAGWVVNRSDGGIADFFSLKQFRAKYNRPAVVDEVLRTLSEPKAIALVSGRESVGSGVRVATKTTESVLPAGFPPVFEEVSGALTITPHGQLKIPYKLRPNGELLDVLVRVSGRPASGLVDSSLRTSDGNSVNGIVSIDLPGKDAVVSLIAKNKFGASEPRRYDFFVASMKTPVAAPLSSQAESLPLKEENKAGSQMASLKSGDSTDVSKPILMAVGTPRIAVSPLAVVPSLPVSLPDAATALPAVSAVSKFAVPDDESGTLYILSIGISNYANPEYKLKLAAKDALDLGEALQKHARKRFDQVVARILVDGKATQLAIRNELRMFKENIGPDDTGILFIAGHGINSRDGKYYYLPHDANANDLAKTGVSEELLRDSLGGVRGKALMLVDTCYGGGALSKAGSVELAGMANDLSSPENGVIVFAASSGRQLSEENVAWNNGAFTSGLLDGIKGKADPYGTGHVTVLGLIHYVSQYVKRLTEGRQTPVAISPAGVPDYPIAFL